MKSVNDLTYYRFDTSEPGVHKDLCNSCYKLWKSEWQNVFNELGVEVKLNSDDFSNKTLGGLFYRLQPIGFILYHKVDTSLIFTPDLKYFNPYPDHVSSFINSQNEKIFVISYLTLDRGWRKSQTDLPVAEILVSLSILNFLQSDTTRLITFSRNDRKVNSIVSRHGGKPLLKAANAYNVEVDFFQILKRDARITDYLECKIQTLKIWQRFLKGETNGIKPVTQHTEYANEELNRENAPVSLDRYKQI